MPNPRNIKLSKAFIKALREQFELDKKKVDNDLHNRVWHIQFANFINKYILEELPKEGNLYTLVYEKAEKGWPKPITINRSLVKNEGASKDLIAVCGTYMFKEKWSQEKIRFQIEAEEQVVLDIGSVFQKYYINNPQFNIIEIIGDKDQELGHLKMDDFYANLSYIEYKELSNRNSLIKKEQENKIRQFDQFEYNRLHLGTDYLSTDVLAQNEQIVITGNPGVGKSTYAKNICYKWAKKKLVIPQIPIYIQLRNLNFQYFEKNVLVYYVWFNYLKTISIEEVEQLFLHQCHAYLFVLDGYDELNRKKQVLLENAIRQLTTPFNKVRYIILSRPYGLLYHKFDKDVVLQIDGFTESSIENYISSFIKNTTFNKSKQELLSIINSNYILKEHAHVPLMLSYMVLIYIREQQPSKYLLDIKSLYDLQSYIFRWLIDYTEGHEQVIEVNNNWKKQAGRLAYEMLMAKEFSYTGNLMNYEITHQEMVEFSKLGLGSIINDNKELQWRFSFSTVTLQEFLASNYILNKITTEAFSYLLKDQYYWNFSKMLLGGLARKKNAYYRIQAIFELLENAYKEQPTSFIRYIYYSLLSETNPKFLNRHINESQINQLLEFYQVSYFDATWHPIIQKATYRIYHKLYPEYKLYLYKTLDRNLMKIKNRKYVFSNEGISVIYSLIDIVNFTKVIEYPPFIETVVESIHVLSKSIKDNSYTEASLKTELYEEHPDLIPKSFNIEMDLFNVVFILFQVLVKVSKENLLPHKNQIYGFKEICSLDLWLDIERTIMKFQDEDEILNELEERIEQLNLLPIVENEYYTLTEMYDDIIENSNEDFYEDESVVETNLTSKHFNLELVYIASSIYKVGKLAIDVDTNLIVKIINATELYIKNILNPTFRLEEITPTTQILIKGLVLINKPQIYDLIFDCVYRLDNDSLLEIPNEIAFKKYITEKLKLLKKAFDIDELLRLSKALESTWNGRYSFFSYRNELSDLLFRVLEDNQDFLNEFKFGLEEYEEEEQNDTEEFNEDSLCILVLNQIIGIPFYAYDRKYFIDKIINYEYQFHYLKYHMIPLLFELDFPFYQDKYWNYLFELDKNKQLGFELLEFVVNDSLYYYSSNLSQFKKLLSKWNKKAKLYNTDAFIREEFEIYAHLYVAVISNTLKLMEESGERYYDQDIIRYAGNVLSLPYVKTVIQENQFLEIYDAPDFVPYIMQYYYTNDKKYIVHFDYIELRNKYIRKTSELIIGLIQLFVTTENGVSMDTLHKLQPVLGEHLYQDILTYINDYNVLYESIEPLIFEKKLN